MLQANLVKSIIEISSQLCLDIGTGSAECWPYRSAFQAGQVVTLTSNCNVSSQWTANNTNMPEQQSMLEAAKRPHAVI